MHALTCIHVCGQTVGMQHNDFPRTGTGGQRPTVTRPVGDAPAAAGEMGGRWLQAASCLAFEGLQSVARRLA